MGVTLEKGERLTLEKEGGGTLQNVMVGLGWDPVRQSRKIGFFTHNNEFDLDASVFEKSNEKILDTIYYGNLQSNDGAIKHMGDNLTGDGEGDDEQIFVQLSKVPNHIDRLTFIVTIFDCQRRKQDFGMIQNAFIRLVDNDTGKELCKYNLSKGYEGKTAMVMGEIYRFNKEWKFRAIGEGTYDHSISELKRRFC